MLTTILALDRPLAGRLSESDEQMLTRRYATLQQELERLYYEDVADARKRDATIWATGKRNTRADSMYILSVIIIAAIFWAVWSKPELPEFVKGVVTLILGRFLGYLDQIFNFEFGTTRSSKEKDHTISALSGGK